MCDWLTGRHGRARWQPAELPCITKSTFTTTIPLFLTYLCFVIAFESVDRCLLSACRRQSAVDLADHAWLEAPRFFGRFSTSRVVSVWFGSPNINGVQPDSLESWRVQVERNMSKGVLVPSST